MELTKTEQLMLAAAPVVAALQAIGHGEQTGKRHPAGVYARAPGGRVYLPGGKTNDQLVAVMIPIGVAMGIAGAMAELDTDAVGVALLDKLKAVAGEAGTDG